LEIEGEDIDAVQPIVGAPVLLPRTQRAVFEGTSAAALLAIVELGQHVDLSEARLVVRDRTVFHGRLEEAAADPARIEQILSSTEPALHLIDTTQEGFAVETKVTEDAANLEQLRALGYLD
jgi:hypothetical protein